SPASGSSLVCCQKEKERSSLLALTFWPARATATNHREVVTRPNHESETTRADRQIAVRHTSVWQLRHTAKRACQLTPPIYCVETLTRAHGLASQDQRCHCSRQLHHAWPTHRARLGRTGTV